METTCVLHLFWGATRCETSSGTSLSYTPHMAFISKAQQFPCVHLPYYSKELQVAIVPLPTHGIPPAEPDQHQQTARSRAQDVLPGL